MNHLLKTFSEEFEAKVSEFKHCVQRDARFPGIVGKIFVAIGMRRTGKTYFLFHIIHQLLDRGIPLTRILYLNFEDDRIAPLSQEGLRTLLDGFYTLHPDNHDEECYLFLDEIQNVENWAPVIRRYLDTKTKKIKLYITGSSSKLLSSEIATSLRGRSFSLEIWPYSFNEYLRAKQFVLQSNATAGKKYFDHLNRQFNEYMRVGGFPEVINVENENRTRILQDYVNVVIFRDIIDRYQVTHIGLLKYLLKLLLKNPGTSFSINKIFNDLKSQGFSVGKNTIHHYLSYFEEAYLIFFVPLYSQSVRKTQTNPKKIYMVDPGLVNAYSLEVGKNIGHLFENIVYLELRRQGHEIYYYLTKSRKEIDFLTLDLQGKWHLYQIVWDTQDKNTLEREINALKEAESEWNIKGEIITPEKFLHRNSFLSFDL